VVTNSLNGQGLCRYMDPETFFPDSYSSDAGLLQVEEARTVCARCPVAAECLRTALAAEAGKGIRVRQKNGIRGGWTPRDRARGRQARNRRQAQIERHGLAA
jgi:WhiB family redox-sensing transcriptional regulator